MWFICVIFKYFLNHLIVVNKLLIFPLDHLVKLKNWISLISERTFQTSFVNYMTWFTEVIRFKRIIHSQIGHCCFLHGFSGLWVSHKAITVLSYSFGRIGIYFYNIFMVLQIFFFYSREEKYMMAELSFLGELFCFCFRKNFKINSRCNEQMRKKIRLTIQVCLYSHIL